MVQVFLRTLTGASLSFDVDTTSSDAVQRLQSGIAERTGIAVDAQRLSYGGRPLTDASVLSTGSHLELSARLKGGGPKKRCAFLVSPTERCSSPATLIGECGECQAKFCSRHRLPEDHSCPKLDNFRKTAYQLNKDKLESEAASAAGNMHNVA